MTPEDPKESDELEDPQELNLEDLRAHGFENQFMDLAGAPLEEQDPLDLDFREALPLDAQIEALIFAAPKPLKASEIHEILIQEDPSIAPEVVDSILKGLVKQYQEQGGGFRLENLRKHGYQFQTVPAAAPLMAKLFATRPRPLSKAALESLAIIAYRQPVTRADVEFVRGVDSGSIIKNLLERELIACVGRKEDAGRPMLFGTTVEFLRVFHLQSLDDLPPLSSFQPAQDIIEDAKRRLGGELDEVEEEISSLVEGEHGHDSSEPSAASLTPSDGEPEALPLTDKTQPTSDV